MSKLPFLGSETRRQLEEPRRRVRRIPVSGILGSLREPADLRVVDLSRRGLSVETAERLQPGKTYMVEVRYDDRPVDLMVDVQWIESRPACTSRGPRRLFRAGAEIVDVLGTEARDQGLWANFQARPVA